MGPNDRPSLWWFLRNGKFRFYWLPGVNLGVYRVFYDEWMLAINCGVFSLEWCET